jgi:hypothetical protein
MAFPKELHANPSVIPEFRADGRNVLGAINQQLHPRLSAFICGSKPFARLTPKRFRS